MPGGPTHREPVGDAAARVDGAKAAAAQHGAHLVHFLEAFLIRLGCGERAGGVGTTQDPGPSTPVRLQTPGPRLPGCRIFTGRWSTPPGPHRCAREPNLESSIAGGGGARAPSPGLRASSRSARLGSPRRGGRGRTACSGRAVPGSGQRMGAPKRRPRSAGPLGRGRPRGSVPDRAPWGPRQHAAGRAVHTPQPPRSGVLGRSGAYPSAGGRGERGPRPLPAGPRGRGCPWNSRCCQGDGQTRPARFPGWAGAGKQGSRRAAGTSWRERSRGGARRGVARHYSSAF